jgi:hypothetical protein
VPATRDILIKTRFRDAMPASKISVLSSGTFVGMVADNPDDKIELKVFHSENQNDHAAIKAEEDLYQPIPEIDNVIALDIQENYLIIKADIQSLIDTEVGILKERKAAEISEEPQNLTNKNQDNDEPKDPAISM